MIDLYGKLSILTLWIVLWYLASIFLFDRFFGDRNGKIISSWIPVAESVIFWAIIVNFLGRVYIVDYQYGDWTAKKEFIYASFLVLLLGGRVPDYFLYHFKKKTKLRWSIRRIILASVTCIVYSALAAAFLFVAYDHIDESGAFLQPIYFGIVAPICIFISGIGFFTRKNMDGNIKCSHPTDIRAAD